MRSLVAPVVALAFMACSNQLSQNSTASVKKSDFGFGNLKGKVESIESTTVDFDSTGKAMGDSIQSLGTYDKLGNIVKEINKDNSGTTTVYDVAYYAHGFLKEEKTTVNGVV